MTGTGSSFSVVRFNNLWATMVFRVDSEKNIVTGGSRQSKKFSVFLSAKTCESGTVGFVPGQVFSKSLRDTLVENDPHAIRAMRGSFASSSA